jgi:hypothetical protein
MLLAILEATHMRRSRIARLAVAIGTVLGMTAIGVVPNHAQSTGGGPTTAPARTPWGEPDLQGIWSGDTLTPLQRPARFANKPTLTAAEEAAIIAEVNARPGRDGRAEAGTEADVAGAYNQIYSPHAAGLSDGRTALIIDPPDGRVPELTATTTTRQAAFQEYYQALLQGTRRGRKGTFSPRRNEPPPSYNTTLFNRADGPEDRGLGERCLLASLPNLGATYRIVQSPGRVAINHDSGQGQGFVRTIPIDAGPHLPPNVRQWLGDARGRWEGNTLVVDTTNFTHKTDFQGSRENLHLIERFTRVSADRVEYQVTVEDPTTFARPWTFMVPWTRQPEKANQVYESNCHEGNAGIIGVLWGARTAEQKFRTGRGPDPRSLDIAILSFDLKPGTGCAGGGIEREGVE